MLGVSKTMVRHLEKRSLVNPIVLDGVHYFTRAQVLKALETRPGAISGPAFALFKKGVKPIDVVVELAADPDHIQVLWKTYNELNHCWVIQGPSSLKAWEGVFKLGELTPELLLRALELVCGNPETRALLKSGRPLPRRKISRSSPA